MKAIVIYGQTQSDLGTRNDTMVPLTGEGEPIGPAVMMEPFLKQIDDHVTACLCCDNGTFLVDSGEVSHKLCTMVNKLQPDMVICGPAFNSADYAGMRARTTYDIDATTKAKTSATVSAENEDTIAAYKDRVAIVKTPEEGDMKLSNAPKNMCTLIKALTDGGDMAELEHRSCFR